MNDEANRTKNGKSRFDPESLRLSQDFVEAVGVKKAILTIPVRKPHRQEFVRAHPDPQFRVETAVLECDEERETYLVDRSLWSEISGELKPKVLFACLSRQSVLFLWPVKLPGEDGRVDTWSSSALSAAELAMKHWIRVASNMSLRAYEIFQATASLPDPEWPDLSMEEMLEVAFKDRFIDDLNHPVVQRLRGAC